MNNMKKARKKLKYTQQDMADLLNVTRPCYSNYERGYRAIPYKKAVEVKKILKLSDDDLLE